MESQSTVNLSYLVALCDGDDDFMNSVISSFVDEMPELLDTIQQKLQEEDWKMVGELAHKLKPSVQFVGMDGTLEKARSIERQCKNTDVCQDQVSSLVSDVTQETKVAITILQELLNKT